MMKKYKYLYILALGFIFLLVTKPVIAQAYKKGFGIGFRAGIGGSGLTKLSQEDYPLEIMGGKVDDYKIKGCLVLELDFSFYINNRFSLGLGGGYSQYGAAIVREDHAPLQNSWTSRKITNHTAFHMLGAYLFGEYALLEKQDYAIHIRPLLGVHDRFLTNNRIVDRQNEALTGEVREEVYSDSEGWNYDFRHQVDKFLQSAVELKFILPYDFIELEVGARYSRIWSIEGNFDNAPNKFNFNAIQAIVGLRILDRKKI